MSRLPGAVRALGDNVGSGPREEARFLRRARDELARYPISPDISNDEAGSGDARLAAVMPGRSRWMARDFFYVNSQGEFSEKDLTRKRAAARWRRLRTPRPTNDNG